MERIGAYLDAETCRTDPGLQYMRQPSRRARPQGVVEGGGRGIGVGVKLGEAAAARQLALQRQHVLAAVYKANILHPRAAEALQALYLCGQCALGLHMGCEHTNCCVAREHLATCLGLGLHDPRVPRNRRGVGTF